MPLDPAILFSAVLNGSTTGAVYALVALGLTLIYGVLHIINFAHGAALMVALYAVYLLNQRLGLDPYAALPLVMAGMFALGYLLQRLVINRASHGRTRTSCWSRWDCPSCWRTSRWSGSSPIRAASTRPMRCRRSRSGRR